MHDRPGHAPLPRHILRRIRGLHPAWGVAIVIGGPLLLFAWAYLFAALPYLTGLRPSDSNLRELVRREGFALARAIEQYHTTTGRWPLALDAAVTDPPAAWRLVGQPPQLALSRQIGPDEYVEYYFNPTNPLHGWVRNWEGGARPLRFNPPAAAADD